MFIPITLLATVMAHHAHSLTTPLTAHVHPVPQYTGFPETVAVPVPPLPCKPLSAAQRAALAPAHPSAADASPQQEMLQFHRMVAKRGCGCCCCKPCCCCCCKPCCCCCCKPCCCCNCCNCCCCCHKCMCICVRPSCCCKCCPSCCGCPGYGCGCRRRRRRALTAPFGYPMPMFLQQLRTPTYEPRLCRELCQVRVLSERSHSIGEVHTNVNLISADDRQRMAAALAPGNEKL
ncbi:hypothetical protein niasHS_005491 [Heterodera schachtii]|uniref:Agouti domain-containing protein n=1 Tax=Heterodera schachtii TaxID=97005 RepID=A0ABD2JJ97_HETSC